MQSSTEIVLAGDENAERLSALRARVGEPADAAVARRAAEQLGTARSWVAQRGSAPIGTISTMSFRTFVQGKIKSFARLGPALVASELTPAERVRTAITLVESALETSPSADGDVVLFAWMGPKAWRVAERELGFETIRHDCRLELAPGDEPDWVAPLANGQSPVLPLARFDHQALWLHERAAPVWGASIVRDDTFLNARVDAAGNSTLAFCVRDAEDVVRGHVILESQPHTLDVIDFLVPDDEVDVGRALLARTIAQAGARRVRAMVPAWSPWFARLQDWGFRVRVGPRVLAMRSSNRRLDFFWLRDHWWHQPLETGSL